MLIITFNDNKEKFEPISSVHASSLKYIGSSRNTHISFKSNRLFYLSFPSQFYQSQIIKQ